MSALNVKHSSEYSDWISPIWLIEMARTVMGSIDLDPATDFNAQKYVKATNCFFDKGLTMKWFGNVFLNPPGGKVGNQSQAVIWWQKLMEEIYSRRVRHAIFVGFSLEILQTSQGDLTLPTVGDFTFCVPRARIKFQKWSEELGRLYSPSSPSHANVIAFVDGPLSDNATRERFLRFFEKMGVICNKG